MGAEETFTPEELVILGEAPEPKPEVQAPPEGEKPPADGEQPPAEGEKPPEQPAPTEEEKAAAEKEGLRIELDDKGRAWVVDDAKDTKIPLVRFQKVMARNAEAQREKAETERKFNLFRELGPDKFYELYPDEKPAGYKPATREEKPAAPEIGNIGAMLVEGGPYNGKTLNEVFKLDPAYATALQNSYLTGQRDQVDSVKRQQEELKAESETEVADFSEQVSTELFGKKAADLTPEEQRRVGDTIQQTLDWMAKTQRGAGIIADAYFLMNRENLLKSAHEKGGKAALESLKKPGIPSIDTGSGKPTGASDFESMTRDQLAAKIEAMSEKEAAKFLKEAPESVKKKHPDLPWD